MSDTLADLASWLPSDFLSDDMDDKTLFLNKPWVNSPYDFASTSSTESESDDDDAILPGLTQRFTRSLSLQERLKFPYPVQKKRVFSGSSPTTPFARPNDDALDLIYAAAGQVARMKLNTVNNAVYGTRGLLGAPRPLATIPPLSQHNQSRTMLNEKQMFIRQQQLLDRVCSSVTPNYQPAGRFVAGRPVGVGVGQSAWPLYHVETQRRPQPVNEFGLKPIPGGGCVRTVKKACAGTGVFLPRNYSNNITPEPKKNQVCSPANPPARVAQSLNKNMDHIVATEAQPNMNGVFFRQNQAPPLPQHHLKCEELAEIIMAHRQKAVMLAQQRRSNSSHEGVPEARMGQTEVVLPQEWTY
ncbi:hypothetical protein M8C21_006267 [Ambrosia artemisiifolia]|uniref:Uncharacterized protein n=1 Tax=Ambrosia artemisiifolia TaxID=4212 RepID=A0AAD5D023_AMBAR|nr:hypothetical protein M8C21_006267 [Ambrosia artemisiifolia]